MEIKEFEEKLWASTYKLINGMDTSGYNHVILVLIFVLYSMHWFN
ncbi:MAG: SAM-dependent DNA methyltransferase [Intestinibacter bartlettii]|nr:class I SAM-dependent DNA methyltransferase [Intestinibacter bartlettii]MBS7147943.1 SAM-dependent DNA methyltransferase [Intestinibacter bartlettii]